MSPTGPCVCMRTFIFIEGIGCDKSGAMSVGVKLDSVSLSCDTDRRWLEGDWLSQMTGMQVKPLCVCVCGDASRLL